MMDRGQWITRSNMLVDCRVTLEGPLELFVGKCGAHHIDKRADVEGQSGEVAPAARMKLEKIMTGPTMYCRRGVTTGQKEETKSQTDSRQKNTSRFRLLTKLAVIGGAGNFNPRCNSRPEVDRRSFLLLPCALFFFFISHFSVHHASFNSTPGSPPVLAVLSCTSTRSSRPALVHMRLSSDVVAARTTPGVHDSPGRRIPAALDSREGRPDRRCTI